MFLLHPFFKQNKLPQTVCLGCEDDLEMFTFSNGGYLKEPKRLQQEIAEIMYKVMAKLKMLKRIK